jgi:16S rRNA (uracil1498-N3)-methyltransferase
MTVRRFFAAPAQFDNGVVTFDFEETRHLRDVLRLKPGDEVHVFDGEGREFQCTITSVEKKASKLEVVREIDPSAPESSLEITLAVSAYKSDKLDLVVQKAVELGVARFSPIVTARGEVRLNDTQKRIERWRKIAMEATKQCERARVMTVDEPLEFEGFVDAVDRDSGLLLMFSEKGGDGMPNTTSQKITALIGPKGGWEDSEIEFASEGGFVPVKLGRRIMKAETAAITFAALLQHRFGDLG